MKKQTIKGLVYIALALVGAIVALISVGKSNAQTVTQSAIYGVGVTYEPSGWRLIAVYAPVENASCTAERERLQNYLQSQEQGSYNELYGSTPSPISRAFCSVQTTIVTPSPGTGGAPCEFAPGEWRSDLSVAENLAARCGL